MQSMQSESLTDKEREIADKILDHDLLRGLSVPQEVLLWATKLASIVDTRDARAADLYKQLRYCLHCETWAEVMAQQSPYGISSIERFKEWEEAHEHYLIEAKLSAYQAAKTAALIHGVQMDTDTLLPKGYHKTYAVLKAAYNALAPNIGPLSL